MHSWDMNHLPFWEKKFNVLLPLCLCKSSSPYTLCPALTCPSQANSFYKTQLLQVLLCLRSLPRTPTRINCTLLQFWGFPGGTRGKESAWQCRRPKRRWLDPWVGHSSIFAWEIPWTEEAGRLQTMGSQTVIHNWATKQHSSIARPGYLYQHAYRGVYVGSEPST